MSSAAVCLGLSDCHSDVTCFAASSGTATESFATERIRSSMRLSSRLGRSLHEAGGEAHELPDARLRALRVRCDVEQMIHGVGRRKLPPTHGVEAVEVCSEEIVHGGAPFVRNAAARRSLDD